MRIAIDLRSLSSGSISGVENYCLNLLENLLPMDKQNTYALFYNVFKKVNADEFHFINSKIKKTRIPNKILNLSFKTRVLKLENLTGPVDCLFMPNLNQINIGPDVKLAITIHDLSPIVTPQYYNLKRKLWHKFINYEKIIARANLLFAVSEHTKLDLVRLFHVPENKITVVYPGVDLKVFYPETDVQKLRAVRNKYSLPGNYILFLNTIEPRKNLDNLLKAFELLPLPVNLVIAGKKGWKYRTIFKKIKMSGKAKQIKYLNYVEEKDKPAIINLARA